MQKKKNHARPPVKGFLFWPGFNQNWNLLTFSFQTPNIALHENSFRDCRKVLRKLHRHNDIDKKVFGTSRLYAPQMVLILCRRNFLLNFSTSCI